MMTKDERIHKRRLIRMALECAAAYVRDDENLEVAKKDIETARVLLAEVLKADEF